MKSTPKIIEWPNATYISLAHVGGNTNFMFRVGGRQILAFFDTNMLVSPTQIFIALAQTPVVLQRSGM